MLCFVHFAGFSTAKIIEIG